MNLDKLQAAMQKVEIHNYMLTRDNETIAQGSFGKHTAEESPLVWSVSKSFMATAFGVARDEGLISLDDKLADLFPQLTPPDAPDYARAITMHDCLCMATGHFALPGHDIVNAPKLMRINPLLEYPPAYKPGTHFYYNSTASYALGRAVSLKTGMRLLDYLKTKVLDKIGITNTWWEQTAEGYDVGGSGLHVPIEGMSKLALLYLNKGMWQGERILSEDWVTKATSSQIDNRVAGWIETTEYRKDNGAGYGYQFWMGQHGTYRGDGAFGQFMIVFPQQRMTFCSTGYLINGQPQRYLDDVYEAVLA
ncbi:MAG: beta-lactamase family protein [Clostridia bacterium]|nr:beta-lactamase family protein [Clostridia bacterium]